MKTDWIATLIKVGAILTAAPRWVGALMAAEGFGIPVAWLPWWVPISAALSAAMALVEGLAFAYVFEAWRNQQGKDNRLFQFAISSALVFVGVLAPYIAASVRQTTLSEILSNGWALAAWSIAVGLSTIMIVASVGYAQKRKAQRGSEKASEPAPQAEPLAPQVSAQPALVYAHTCGRTFASQQALAGHIRSCKAGANGHTN